MQVQRSFGVLSQHEEGMDSKLSLMSSKAMETRYYEGCGREGPIRCIFLGEFHPVAGPKISCQFPEDYISKEVFDSISAYIIPKPLIQKCTMTINALGHKIVGYPIRIDNSRYERNVYVFNLCFVCDSWSKTVQYEPVVKKLGEHLTIMEEETRFVSSGSSKLPTLLAHLLHDLNTHRKATIVDDIGWTIEDYEEEMEVRQELRRVEAGRSPMVRNVRARALGIRGWSRKARLKKNRRKPPGKQTCRPRSRSLSRTSSRSPSSSPSRSASRSRSCSRTEARLSQSTSSTASSEAPPARKSRSRSPLSRPKSRNKSVASETAKLHSQTKSLEACSPTDIAAMMEADSCLEKFISVFRDIHKSITKINRINSDIARQYNISNLWSEFDANRTFTMVTSWLRSVNEYSHIMDWDVTETVYFAIAELSRCATRWAEVHSTSHYRWKHWQAKVVLAYAAYQSFGSLLPEMVYKTSDDEETLEEYYHGKVLALYRCGIEGKRAVECIIHGIRNDTIRIGAKGLGFKYPEELLQYLKSVRVCGDGRTLAIKECSFRVQSFT